VSKPVQFAVYDGPDLPRKCTTYKYEQCINMAIFAKLLLRCEDDHDLNKKLKTIGVSLRRRAVLRGLKHKWSITARYTGVYPVVQVFRIR
jgi:hypothetical protein